jgi:hypothetical protein
MGDQIGDIAIVFGNQNLHARVAAIIYRASSETAERTSPLTHRDDNGAPTPGPQSAQMTVSKRLISL